MQDEISKVLVCVTNNESEEKYGRVLVTCGNRKYSVVNKKELSKIASKRTDIYSKIEFVDEKKFIETLARYNTGNFSKKVKKIDLEVAKYYKNRDIDIDDIDLGLSDSDLDDMDIIKNKLTFLKKVKVRVFAGVMSLALVAGAGYAIKKSIASDNNGKIISINKHINNESTSNERVVAKAEDKDFYELVNLTNSSTQGNQMSNIGRFLTIYNTVFANEHKEKGIKPSLTWDEAISLALAYSKDNSSIKETFNGAKFNSVELIENYKSAINQLTDAFIIENKKINISLDTLTDSEELKSAYNEVNYLFLKAKNSDKDDLKKNVTRLYKGFYKHIYAYNDGIKYLLIEPIVKASNKLFKSVNISNDFDGIKNYYNGLDYKNYRNSKFRDIVIYSSDEINEYNVLYKQFRDAEIKQLKEYKDYNIKKRNIKYLNDYDKSINKVKRNTKKNKTYKYTKK